MGTIGSNPNNMKKLFDNFFPLLSAEALLADWSNAVSHFVKVYPDDYRRVLEEQAAGEQSDGEMAA